MKPLDLIGAIELAYDRTNDEANWLAAFLAAIAPAFAPVGAPITAFAFELRGDDAFLGTTAAVGEPLRHTREQYERLGTAAGRHGPARAGYECEMYTLLSRVIGPLVTKESIVAAGMAGDEAVGLRANATPDSGVLITRLGAAGHRLRKRALWGRVAAHLGAGLRLRRRQRVTSPDDAAAVLSPSGHLEHGSAEAIAAREDLGGAARAIDRARGKLRRLDPEEATALWRTLVRSEWSLVDWVDHDGKRFLLAEDNRIARTPPKTLTKREQQVVACAAMGHSNKLIAYDLGLSVGTVSVTLVRSAKKLGVSDRVSLVRVFRETYRR